MKHIFAIMCMALLVPSLGVAQGWNWTVSADLLWTRPSINWHDDELSLRSSQRLVLVGLQAESPQLKLRYSLTTGFGMADTITPQAALFVGSTNLGKDPTQSGQQGQDKPVSLEWTMQPTSRIEVSGPFYRGVRPLAVCEWSGLTMTGTKDDNGKEKKDTETLQKTFMGLGAHADYSAGRTGGRALLVGSNGYLFGEVVCAYRVFQQCAITAGWQWRTLKFERTTVRVNGGYAGVEVFFNGP